MFRLLYVKFLIAGFIAAMFASCSEETEPQIESVKQEVTFTCQVTPDIKSRSQDGAGQFGDGTNATNLRYILMKNNSTVLYSSWTSGSPTPLYQGRGQFLLKLEIDNKADYDLFLWADELGTDSQNPNKLQLSPILATTNVTNSTKDTQDAFYAYTRLYDKTTKQLNTSIDLRRPYCQVNIVTDEFDLNGEFDKTQSFLYSLNTGFAFERWYDDFVIPNKRNFTTGAITSTSLDDVGGPIATMFDERTTYIDGRKMRYLFVGYYFANEDGSFVKPEDKPFVYFTKGSASNFKPIYLDLKDSFKPNNRIFIYPKKGTTFFGEVDVNIGVQIVPGINSSSNINPAE